MITETDALSTVEFKEYFVILPSTPLWDVDAFMSSFDGAMCPPDFRYSSGENDDWLDVDRLKQLIQEHVDPGSAS